jgi:integrase/recombinase XerD
LPTFITASFHLFKNEEKFNFTPHKLRHTFLKRLADKHGVYFAQQMNDNASIKEVSRYVKPGQSRIIFTL